MEEFFYFVGLDPATKLGYCVIRVDSANKNVIIEKRGEIVPSYSLSLPQKLNIIAIELDKILAEFPPNRVFIEEPPYTFSGVKVLTNLARINGVVILAAFAYTQNISLFEPTYWKANSLDGIHGNSPKWKIQLEVCRHFDLLPERSNVDISDFDRVVSQKQSIIDDKTESIRKKSEELDVAKRKIAYKRNLPTEDEKKQLQNKIKQLSTTVKSEKLELKTLQKEIDKELAQIGKDIYSQTGISDNIADAICIAMCGLKQVLEEKDHGSTR